MSRSTWASSHSQTIGNTCVGCGYASTSTMSAPPAVNVVVKFGGVISYFYFLTDCLYARHQYLFTKMKAVVTDRRAGYKTSVRGQNFERDLSVIPSSYEYLTAVGNSESISANTMRCQYDG